jgi:hypothetical protein
MVSTAVEVVRAGMVYVPIVRIVDHGAEVSLLSPRLAIDGYASSRGTALLAALGSWELSSFWVLAPVSLSLLHEVRMRVAVILARGWWPATGLNVRWISLRGV